MKILIIVITVIQIINGSFAQKSSETEMNNIEYQHKIPPSFESKLIHVLMVLFGMKKKMEKKMIANSFVKEAVKPPKSLLRNYNIMESNQRGRKIWTIAPKENKSDVVILYLHGGAYMANITGQHWDLIEQLLSTTSAKIVVPDYPLTPEAVCEETYDFIDALFSQLITEFPAKRVIIMGDSAGGGLAFGFVQQLRNNKKKQPEQIVIFSPWLDVTMNNPNIELIEKEDKILSIKGLRNAGQKYAGNLDLKDFRVSPIYGDFTGLCKVSIFTGTKDILNADAQKCKQIMKDQQISFNYFEYSEMFHDWVIISGLKESHNVIYQVGKLVND